MKQQIHTSLTKWQDGIAERFSAPVMGYNSQRATPGSDENLG